MGPLAKTVKDAARILQAIAGPDSYDNYTSAIPPGPIPDYVAACNASALSGVRLGVPTNVLELYGDNTTVAIHEAFYKQLEVLTAAGATIIHNANFTAAAEFQNSSIPLEVLNADFVVNLKTYLDLLTYNPQNITDLAVLRNFTHTVPAEEWPLRDTKIWDLALEGFNNTDPRFWPLYLQNLYFGQEGGQLGAIQRNNLDAIVIPTIYGHSFAALTGDPVITVPMGAYPADTPITRNSWGLVETAPNIPYVAPNRGVFQSYCV